MAMGFFKVPFISAPLRFKLSRGLLKCQQDPGLNRANRKHRNQELPALPPYSGEGPATYDCGRGGQRIGQVDAVRCVYLLELSIPRKLRAWQEPGVRFVVIRLHRYPLIRSIPTFRPPAAQMFPAGRRRSRRARERSSGNAAETVRAHPDSPRLRLPEPGLCLSDPGAW